MNHEKLPYSPKPEDLRSNQQELNRLRAQIERDTAAFLAAGGQIEQSGRATSGALAPS